MWKLTSRWIKKKNIKNSTWKMDMCLFNLNIISLASWSQLFESVQLSINKLNNNNNNIMYNKNKVSKQLKEH